MTSYNAGQKVVVKSGLGYVNEGATGVLAADFNEGNIWADIKWDESSNLNGFYAAVSLDFVDESVSDTEALAALVEQAEADGYARGVADAEANGVGQVAISDGEKQELREAFNALTARSNDVVDILRRNNIL